LKVSRELITVIFIGSGVPETISIVCGRFVEKDVGKLGF
jgi:hypothetical protein